MEGLEVMNPSSDESEDEPDHYLAAAAGWQHTTSRFVYLIYIIKKKAMGVPLGLCLVQMIILLSYNFFVPEKEKVTEPKPFRVFWRVPHDKCISDESALDELIVKLESYGIEVYFNKDERKGWVPIIYNLKWPEIGKNGTWKNGGLPQYADLEGHLLALREKVNSILDPHHTGMGALRMDAWKPVVHHDDRIVTNVLIKEVNQTTYGYPNMTYDNQELIAKAIETYETGARNIMEATLKEAIKLRPEMKWGYYSYPHKTMTGERNDKIPWLWNATTAFFPSLTDHSTPSSRYYREEMLAETFRVRAKYGDPFAPIYALETIQFGINGYSYNETLHNYIDATINRGADGIIIKASSKLFDNQDEACRQLFSYVEDVLGPRIKALQEKMTECSSQLCAGHGRCVSQFYVGKIDYILDRGSPQREILLQRDKRPDEETTKKEFLDNYACQCYENWVGRWCRLER